MMNLEIKKQELSEQFTVSTLPTSTADDISLALIHLQALINLMKVDGVTDKAEIEFLKELLPAVKLNAEQTSDLQSRLAAKNLVGIDFSPYQNHPDEALKSHIGSGEHVQARWQGSAHRENVHQEGCRTTEFVPE